MSNEELGRYFGIGYTVVSQVGSRLKREMKENRLTPFINLIKYLLSGGLNAGGIRYL